MKTVKKYHILILVFILIALSGCKTVQPFQRVVLQRDPNYVQPARSQPAAPAANTAVSTAPASAPAPSTTVKDDAAYERQLMDITSLFRMKGFAQPPVATVMNFKSQGLSEMDSQFISDYLSSALYNTKAFRIIDRSQRETLLQELSFSMSGCSDETCQLEAGRLLSADKIIVGNIGGISSRFLMDVRMIDVASGETVSVSNNIYGSLDEMVDDCRFVALNLTEGFLMNN